MSYFSIIEFIKSGQMALDSENYFAALSVALMLPSMCSRIQFRDNSKYIQKGNYKDKLCYTDWCKAHFGGEAYLKTLLGENFEEVLYMLRCDIVHAGTTQIFNNKGYYLSIGKNGRCQQVKDYMIVDIESLCKEIFSLTKNWIDTIGSGEFQYTRVFNTADHRDMLLYNRLYDDYQTEFMVEALKKEQERLQKEQTTHEHKKI